MKTAALRLKYGPLRLRLHGRGFTVGLFSPWSSLTEVGPMREVGLSMATTATTPERELEPVGKAAGPCVFVLFGAAGDLTKRKLIPALFNLVKAKLLPDNFAVMGVSVDDLTVEAFRNRVGEFLPSGEGDAHQRDWLRPRLFYERGDFGDPETFSKLRE